MANESQRPGSLRHQQHFKHSRDGWTVVRWQFRPALERQVVHDSQRPNVKDESWEPTVADRGQIEGFASDRARRRAYHNIKLI